MIEVYLVLGLIDNLKGVAEGKTAGNSQSRRVTDELGIVPSGLRPVQHFRNIQSAVQTGLQIIVLRTGVCSKRPQQCRQWQKINQTSHMHLAIQNCCRSKLSGDDSQDAILPFYDAGVTGINRRPDVLRAPTARYGERQFLSPDRPRVPQYSWRGLQPARAHAAPTRH